MLSACFRNVIRKCFNEEVKASNKNWKVNGSAVYFLYNIFFLWYPLCLVERSGCSKRNFCRICTTQENYAKFNEFLVIFSWLLLLEGHLAKIHFCLMLRLSVLTFDQLKEDQKSQSVSIAWKTRPRQLICIRVVND